MAITTEHDLANMPTKDLRELAEAAVKAMAARGFLISFCTNCDGKGCFDTPDDCGSCKGTGTQG